jgi:hypothetical protein
MTTPDPITHARRINRTWIVRGGLAETTTRYLDALEARDVELLRAVCELAVTAAKQASHEQRDPKPDFYASLFSRTTEEEREEYLRDHAWTRRRAAALAAKS